MKKIIILLIALAPLANAQLLLNRTDQQALKFTRGDGVTLRRQMDTLITGAGDSITFTVKLSVYSTAATFIKKNFRARGADGVWGTSAQIAPQSDSATTGNITITLDPNDTKLLTELSYVWDLKLGTRTMMRGTIFPQPSYNGIFSYLTILTDTLNANIPRTGGTGITANSLRDSLNAAFTTGTRVLKTAADLAGGKGDSDSLSTTTATANAALPMADTTKLHAQLFAIINNVLAGKLSADSGAQAIAAKFALADTTKLHAQLFAVLNDKVAGRKDSTTINGTKGVSFTVTPAAAIDSALTLGARSISTAGRFAVGADSVAAMDIDWSLSNAFYKTLGSSTSFTFSNVPTTSSQTITIFIVNAAGNYTLGWPATVRWSGGTAPTVTVGAGKVTVVTLISFPSRGTQLGSYILDFGE